MKVKILSGNILADYKKVGKGAVIDLADSIAERFIKAGLVESIKTEESTPEPLIIKLNDKDVDLNKLTVKNLIDISESNNLGITQVDGEVKAVLAKRVFNAYNSKG